MLKSHFPKMGTKGQALEYFRAKINHKKLPIFKAKEVKKSPYKQLSIEEYESKYK